MKNIIITGVNGFVGVHAAEAFRADGFMVFGVGREQQPDPGIADKLDGYYACDLTDPDSVAKLDLQQADSVLHLAGIPTTNNEPKEAERVLKINVAVHEVLYAALLGIGSKARIISVGTALSYDPRGEMPLSENSKMLADIDGTNPYIRSKLRVLALTEHYRKLGLDIIDALPSNHTGPGQGLGLFVPDKTDQILKALQTGQALDFGDKLDFWKDFTDVRDVAQAYLLLAKTPRELLTSTRYNIGSGQSAYGQDIVVRLAELLGFKQLTANLNSENSTAQKIIIDAGLLASHTGWARQIPFDQTLCDYVASLRQV